VVTVRPRLRGRAGSAPRPVVRGSEALSAFALTLPILLMVVVSGLYLAIWLITGRRRPGGHLGPGPWGSQDDWPPFVVPAAIPWAVVGAMVLYAIIIVVVRQRGAESAAGPGEVLFWYTLGSTQLYLYGSFFDETAAWSRTPRIGAVVVLLTGLSASVMLRIRRSSRARRLEERQL